VVLKLVMILGGIGVSALLSGFGGCVHRSGGEWMVDSAPLPEGWPAITPVGEVEVKEYPVYRAASVHEDRLGADGMRPMFMELFGHIKKHDIAMTAPVDMSYEVGGGGDARMDAMAFLYRSTSLGETGEDGAVRVADVPARTYASVGTRGGYTTKRFLKGLGLIEGWLSESAEWRAAGEPRFLGYNGPFVPWFMRYGEVQIPVEPRGRE